MSIKQTRPDQVVNILEADFQSRYEHGFAWASICAMFLDLPGLRAFWSGGDVDQYGKLADASGQGNTLTNNNTALVNTRPLPPYIEFTGSEYLTQATGAGGVALGAGTLNTTTTNDTSIPNHTHEVITTSDGETNVSTILASDANGRLRLDALGIGAAPSGADIITIVQNIDHAGDANTYHGFPAVDTWRVVCGGITMLDVVEGASDYVNFTAGLVFINDTANAFMTRGLTINMGAAANEILTLKSSNVAHGITSVTETDSYGVFRLHDSTSGGLRMRCLTEDTVASSYQGYITNDSTGKNATADGAIIYTVFKKSGTGVGNLGAGQNIFNIKGRIGGSARNVAIFAEDGDLYLDTVVNANAWDAYDDALLLHGFRASLVPDGHALKQRFGKWVDYARPILEATGIVHYNEDGHHFVASKGLQMLTIDAVRQLYERLRQLEERIQ